MRKLCILLALLLVPIYGNSDTINLDSTETLQVPTSQKISDWQIVLIDASAKVMRIKYRWRDASNDVIDFDNSGWKYWTCQDVEVPGTNAECIDTGDPYPCCTGAGTGTCDDMLDTCFTDVFSFDIRAQDVGTPIGVGLRQLIWNQMKQDILTGGNDGTFE